MTFVKKMGWFHKPKWAYRGHWRNLNMMRRRCEDPVEVAMVAGADMVMGEVCNFLAETNLIEDQRAKDMVERLSLKLHSKFYGYSKQETHHG